MRRGRVVLVDPSVLGQSHLLVNLGIVRICAKNFARVDVVAEREHCAALAVYGAERTGNVVLHPYSARTEITPHALRQIDPDCPVVFLNLEYLLFVRMMTSRMARGRSVHWILHSHFALRPRGAIARTKFALRKALLFSAFPSARFIVLGERVRQNLLRVLGGGAARERVAAVVHPLGIEPLEDQIREDAATLRVSFVKGWHPLSPRAEAMVARLERAAAATGRFRFEVISSAISRRPDGSPVVSSDYLARLARLARTDLVVYLPGDDYSLQASGALMDSFVSRRPLMGLRVDFEREIESLTGPIGFFFDRDEDLAEFATSLLGPALRREVETFRQNLIDGYGLVMDQAERQLMALLPVAAARG